MKITSWNVNGLRAIFRKEADQFWKEQEPDLLCLQEVRARPDQIPPKHRASLEGYHAHWNAAERPGYSGVATFSREKPLEHRKGMGVELYDREGRVIQTRHPGFTLFNVYFPNGQRSKARLDYKLEFYGTLLENCQDLRRRGEEVILCGDFNTAHREIDLRNPQENADHSGFLPEERAWIDRYLACGFRDAYRELYPEREEYTWWTYRYRARERNIGWRLDYFLVSEDLLPQVEDVIIHTEAPGSDHCPVTLVIQG